VSTEHSHSVPIGRGGGASWCSATEAILGFFLLGIFGFRQAAVSFLLSGGVEEDANYLILLAS
jgi:hypothetical protein